MTSSIDEFTALDRAHDDLARVVSNLGTDELTMPTCCTGWDVRGLLGRQV